MAGAATTTHIKVQTQPIKPKRRHYRETTITTTSDSDCAAVDTVSSDSTSTPSRTQNHYQSNKLDTPMVVSPGNSWYCSASKPPSPPVEATPTPSSLVSYPFPPSSPNDPIFRQSPSIMDSHSITAAVNGGANPAADFFPSSFSKFNSALTAGLLNPMSPPPFLDKTRSSPTLFEMISNEPDCGLKPTTLASNGVVSTENLQSSKNSANPPPQDKQALMRQRLLDLLVSRSPGNQFNDVSSGDVKLTLSSKDGVSVSMSVHGQILVTHSRFFASKLNEKWVKQQRSMGPCIVEIADCDDIEVYIESLRLMYCKDLRKELMREDVPRVLGILKVSAAIGFDAGVLSCLEYLEAAPWAEDEEEKVASLLSELRLEGVGALEVLKRVSVDINAGVEYRSDNEEVLLKLLHVVLEGKDEKARREMKNLVTKMLRENPSHTDLSKESLYSACDGCLNFLRQYFLKAAREPTQHVGQIARQADNLHWLLDILIDRQIADEFLKTWASQSELSKGHSEVPVIHRYEVSRVTARFFVGIGKGQLLASKDTRCKLLQTWLVPFYDDFGWMRRAFKGHDQHSIEEGLSNTILTLPMPWQQEIFLSWFDRFLNAGDDCPNIQRGFEIWWRRAFWRRKGEPERPRQMRIMTATIENS